MLSRTDLRGTTPTAAQLRRALPRGGTDVNAVLSTVTPVIEDVKAHGASAALDYGERFDKVRPTSVRVPAQVIADAAAGLDPAVTAALRESITRARAVHADQRRATVTTQVAPGGQVAEKWVPVRRVGLYVPGGTAAYPSSVLMNAVPARVAGVPRVVVVSVPSFTAAVAVVSATDLVTTVPESVLSAHPKLRAVVGPVPAHGVKLSITASWVSPPA